ncbi:MULTISPECIES: MerR family transcriptional regulator [Acinetobacter]|uniref:MerR family transcriptional regulator n=1 Tax=Acinetobacter junii TaxID=40215 RepID=A0A8F6MLT3_ACIJU|nr:MULTISPECIES: MerR family transcriptional regulator [Acinetobacter]MDH1004584.1 MerR family transcriptional regulator [Acinetobacter junii]MDH1858912.1 MerR family transcriptional regulator [Acinetobacter junii]MDI6621284.1 MerR family transcriptional regulator [Acinetobacter junii]MDU2407759.1 MerR family transcriptional regulator [Acinetobacter junii]MDU6054616.1 MerR family transcriptional regulator [Acinetobacter junii]
MMNFTIGQLSKKSGVSIDTIRYYEKIGLLEKAKRTAGNYRHYSEKILSELLFLKHCRELGITLQDIQKLKELSTHPNQTCIEVDHLIDHYLNEVSQKIQNLEHLKQDFIQLKQQCSQHRTIEQCGILKGLHQPLECDLTLHQHKKASQL